ncbi:thioesterase family protein [Xylariaceae sp. FL0804]|nr:thioesterase family protein [Xylariaceae sp. FL0804]
MASTLKEQISLEQIAPNTYTASWHVDWTLGSTLFGGSVAAIVHHAAATYLAAEPTLAARKQTDVLTLHLEFLRPCGRTQSTIVVTPLKIGAVSSTIQLQLSQGGQVKVLGLATSTNFDQVLGPTVPTAWRPLPPPHPVPDFQRILAHHPDPNWLPARLSGEIIPVTSRLLVLNPRGGHSVVGTCDAWNGCISDNRTTENRPETPSMDAERVDVERMDATYLAMMTDIIPSMSDTLLRNNGLYDAHAFFEKMECWAESHPGVPAQINNSVAEALQATTYNNTLTLDIEYKRRLPSEGLRWIFTRTSTRMLQQGRMDLDITMCNEDMELVCTARQLVLVLEAQRKFGRKSGSSL